MGLRILSRSAIALFPIVMLGCARVGPNPAEQPAIEPASPASTPGSIDPSPTSPSAAPVAFQPAPILGAPIGPEVMVRIEKVEGVDTARANAAFTRAAAGAQECAGAGTVLYVRMTSNEKGREIDVQPKTVLDDIQRRCVIDALSTVQLEDPSSGPSSDLLHGSDRFSAQLVLSW